MLEKDLIKEINEQLQKVQLDVMVAKDSYKERLAAIANRINILVATDFSRLISILYRLDISEKKLRGFLSHPGNETAGEIIAKMIIERQLQKIEAKKRYRSNHDIPEADWW